MQSGVMICNISEYPASVPGSLQQHSVAVAAAAVMQQLECWLHALVTGSIAVFRSFGLNKMCFSLHLGGAEHMTELRAAWQVAPLEAGYNDVLLAP